MGYYAYSIESDFLILNEKKQDALRAIREKLPEFQNQEDFSKILSDFGVFSSEDEKGNIVEVVYDYNKFYTDLGQMLEIIAPYVEKGSYFAFRGEDDCLWAYYFDGAACQVYQGAVIFPDMPEDRPRRP